MNRRKDEGLMRKILRFTRELTVSMLAATFLTCVATPKCLATEWWVGVDDHPRQVAPNMWYFSIKLPVKPMGQLQFVGSQYDFAGATQGFAVDYKANGGGTDFADPGTFYVIAPTLFDTIDGYINGWDAGCMDSKTFSGVVYANAPL